jgi:uncharacterized DUF497 family protein
MQFEWDQRKASLNLRKHRVAFTDAIAVFFDPLARIFGDPDHSDDEERELIVGYAASRLLVVSFVERRGSIRIISARRATTAETNAHETYIK